MEHQCPSFMFVFRFLFLPVPWFSLLLFWGCKAPPTTNARECAVAISVRTPDDGTLVPIDVEDMSAISIYQL